MSHILRAGDDDFYIIRSKCRKRRMMLIMAMDWYDPVIVMVQTDGEHPNAFRRRAEKKIKFSPLTWSQFKEKRWIKITTDQEAAAV